MFAISVLLIVITIKSSLALSLGMVGALSVIRFRTAIKEPEQLTTLLMTLAIAIAIAAEKEILAILFLVVYYFIYPKKSKEKKPFNGKKVFQVFLDRKENVFEQKEVPAFYKEKLNRISNVDNTTILEFLVQENNEADEIVKFFNEKYPSKFEYELA